MRRRRRLALPASIAALLRRALRMAATGGASVARPGRSESPAPLTVIGRLRASRQLEAANDPEAG